MPIIILPRRDPLSRRSWLLLSVLVLVTLALATLTGCLSPNSRASRSGPWDMKRLSAPPTFEWGMKTGLVQEVFYAGESFRGNPTRIFAYLARPADSFVSSAGSKRPAMVLVHGGGGKAFKDWAEHWARRGYVALAMDLAGHGPNGRLPDGGPDQSDDTKFRTFTADETADMWTYHAVAAVVRGHSLLRSLPEVDSERVGITGISWGGYLTCIVAGIDPRFKVAVPVYGCGFLGDNSFWKGPRLDKMPPETRALWLRNFDPSQYLGGVRRPILFVNGTTDFAYPLDSYQKSYRLVRAPLRHVSVENNRPHGHIWTFPEVDAFVGHVLLGSEPLVRMGPPRVKGNQLVARLDDFEPLALKEKSFCYTTNSGPWQKRTWFKAPATLDGRKLGAELPSTRPLVAYLAVKDINGRHISSEHVELSNDAAVALSSSAAIR